ncbi:MAG: hypothetical protein ACI9X0_000640 [Kiritimatiellia bacterium]|jgi:hypothetical protein
MPYQLVTCLSVHARNWVRRQKSGWNLRVICGTIRLECEGIPKTHPKRESS